MHSSIKKTAIVLGIAAFSFFSFGISAFAHVTVKPAQVGIGAYQTFTLSAPVEKPVPTTQLRLVMPEGLESVSPNVKPGWEVEIKKTGEGEEAKVTELIWKGGKIPAGMRDTFDFSAKTPAKAATLQWKAYQTYEDGTVVNWDMDSKAASHDDESVTPFSVTEVVDDLSNNTDTHSMTSDSFTSNPFAAAASVLSVISLAISLAVLTRMKK